MFARTTIVRFKPGTEEQAEHFVREIMLPTASKGPGFRGALFLKNGKDAGNYIIISLWETEAGMLASRPPDELLPQLAAFGEHIAEADQGSYEVLLHLEKSLKIE